MINNEIFLLYAPTEEYFGKALAEYFPRKRVADSLHVVGAPYLVTHLLRRESA
jgi:hypothetical protein